MTIHCWGERATGDWILEVYDTPSQLRNFKTPGKNSLFYHLVYSAETNDGMYFGLEVFLHLYINIILFLKILFIHERYRERGRDISRGRSRLPTGSPMWDSIPGSQPDQRQTLNHGATQVPQHHPFSCDPVLCVICRYSSSQHHHLRGNN